MLPLKSGRDKISEVPVFTCRWEGQKGQNIPRRENSRRLHHTHACFASEVSIAEVPRGEREWISLARVFLNFSRREDARA